MKDIGNQDIHHLLRDLENRDQGIHKVNSLTVKSSLVPTPEEQQQNICHRKEKKKDTFLEKDKICSLNICQNISHLEIAVMKVVSFQTPNGLIIQPSDYLEGTCISCFNFRKLFFHCGIKCTMNPLSRNRIHTLNKW